MDKRSTSRILVVDDSPTMRRMVIASLRAVSGATFGEASNGLDAIEQLALAPAALIILDLNMPDMHGLELLDFLRKHQNYRATPVIILTTRGDDASREAAMAAGATMYLTKPFGPEDLADRAAQFLKLAQEERRG